MKHNTQHSERDEAAAYVHTVGILSIGTRKIHRRANKDY